MSAHLTFAPITSALSDGWSPDRPTALAPWVVAASPLGKALFRSKAVSVIFSGGVKSIHGRNTIAVFDTVLVATVHVAPCVN